jgi:putative regulator of septum formation
MNRNWIIGIVVAVVGAIVGWTQRPADRDATGAIVAEGSVDAFQVRVGDCFDDAALDGDEVNSVAGVPCSKPHDNEVYAVFDVAEQSFPGEALAGIAHEGCLERFEGFVGNDYESSSLDIATMYPSRESWQQQSDREVICAVYDLEEKKLTGTAKGTRL